jgi:LmbE family N-acetylglucosaminyl deacetylase
MTAHCVMAVFAHPDDESLLAGGTLAACAAAGREVVLVCATRGERGPIASRKAATRATLGAVREAELRAAAQVLGVREVALLGYPDGELAWVAQHALVDDLLRQLRDRRPRAVITFGPEGLYWHPDHLAVHACTLAALNAWAAEGHVPWVYFATYPAGRMRELAAAVAARRRPADLWGLDPDLFGAPPESITTVRNVRPFLGVKLQALRRHRSQLAATHLFRTIPDDLAEKFLGREYFVRARAPGAGGDWLARVPVGPASRWDRRPAGRRRKRVRYAR